MGLLQLVQAMTQSIWLLAPHEVVETSSNSDQHCGTGWDPDGTLMRTIMIVLKLMITTNSLQRLHGQSGNRGLA